MPQKTHIPPLVPNQPPWLSLGFVLSLALLGAYLGQLVGNSLAFSGIKHVADMDTASLIKALLLMQAITASSAFIVAPWFYLRFCVHQNVQTLFQWQQGYTTPILLTLGLTLAFMIVNTWFIQWNITVKLPPQLRAFEIWAQEKEETLQKFTILVTTFHSLKALGIGLVVIGVIPAIGEELLFRGIVQQICYKLTHNVHGAIGISAFIFSAIHLQFYGLVPRFLLGALFGYIFWWTKDLAFPIAAHLFNNAFVLLMRFLYQQGSITQDITKPIVPTKAALCCAALLVVVLAHYLRQLSKKHNT